MAANDVSKIGNSCNWYKVTAHASRYTFSGYAQVFWQWHSIPKESARGRERELNPPSCLYKYERHGLYKNELMSSLG